jgi:hypothetical protein
MGEAILEEEDAGPPVQADAGPPVEPDAGPPPALEVAVRIRGRVERENAEGGWERLDRRTSSVPAGSHLRVARGGAVTATRGDESVRATGPGEVVVGPGSGALVSISAGRGSADASTVDVTVDVPGGSFVARGGGNGTQSTVAVTGGNATVNSRRGSVELRGRTDRYTLRDSDTGTIRADGALDVTGRAPARAHVAIPAGASATIHDPSGTVAVQITFEGACSGEGSVEVGRGGSFRRPSARSFGTGRANVLLSPGSHRYRVRCSSAGTSESGAAATGTISVRRDSGSQALPRRPSRNTVDADGRRYTILYQNILPIVTFRWPNPPTAGSYVLHVGSDTHTTSSPSHTLESGEVSEGTHQVFFEAGANRSQTTTLRVGYDNATSAAYIREPSPSARVSGTVRVSGVCVAGCEVSVGGVALPLDSGARFSGDATVPTDLDALAIRIVHPRTGIHYYLRRAGGR